MAVCADCHERHHNASRRIPLSRLSSTHLEFAREVLGDYADDYLARYYGDA
jgi:cytochrome c553